MERHEEERLCGKCRVDCGLHSYNLRDIFTWRLLKTIAMGQILSLLICGTAVSCQYLADAGVETPMLQSFLNYVLLLLFYTTILSTRKGDRNILHILKTKWWKYLVMGLADVEANYAVVKAYQFTTLTSIQLLDCFVIPVLMLLSWFLLKTRYRMIHFVAVMVCLLGVGAMVGADILAGRDQGSTSDVVLGDGLVLLSAVLYAVSNVCQEYTVKNLSRVEFLGMMGLFGTLISGIQLTVLEIGAVQAIKWDFRISMLFAVYALCMYALYSFMPVVVKMTSATAVNLSLLTADLFSLFCGIFLFHYTMCLEQKIKTRYKLECSICNCDSFQLCTSSRLSSSPRVLSCSTPFPHTLLYLSPAPVRTTPLKCLPITRLRALQTIYCQRKKTLRDLRRSYLLLLLLHFDLCD